RRRTRLASRHRSESELVQTALDARASVSTPKPPSRGANRSGDSLTTRRRKTPGSCRHAGIPCSTFAKVKSASKRFEFRQPHLKSKYADRLLGAVFFGLRGAGERANSRDRARRCAERSQLR